MVEEAIPEDDYPPGTVFGIPIASDALGPSGNITAVLDGDAAAQVDRDLAIDISCEATVADPPTSGWVRLCGGGGYSVVYRNRDNELVNSFRTFGLTDLQDRANYFRVNAFSNKRAVWGITLQRG